MKLGAISLWNGAIEDFRAQLRLADQLGFGLVGVGEVPTGCRDVYVSLAQAVTETKTALIGPMITAPHLRHPLATVRAMSALQELSCGRAVLGFGAGNSIALGTGQRLAPLKEVREYILTMRSLFEGEPVTWNGGLIKPLRHVHRVPIYYSALGPKAMGLAGEVADGVIMITGSLEHARASIDRVHEGARAAGRKPSDVTLWVYSQCATGPTRQAALREIAAVLAATMGVYVNVKERLDQVPDDIRPRLLEAQRRYDYNDHAKAASANAQLAEEFGLLEFLAQDRAIVGTPSEVRDKLAALSQLGISLVMCPVSGFVEPERSLRDLIGAARGL